jgi:hypothetical protein
MINYFELAIQDKRRAADHAEQKKQAAGDPERLKLLKAARAARGIKDNEDFRVNYVRWQNDAFRRNVDMFVGPEPKMYSPGDHVWHGGSYQLALSTTNMTAETMAYLANKCQEYGLSPIYMHHPTQKYTIVIVTHEGLYAELSKEGSQLRHPLDGLVPAAVLAPQMNWDN